MRTSLVLSAVLALLAVGAVGVVAQSATTRPPARPAAAKPTTTVNLNTATAAELQTLPGIGARTADRILEYRQKKGPFKKIEELMNVQGIGEKSFLKLRSQITVGVPDAGAPAR
jgi:competence protein ComEA